MEDIIASLASGLAGGLTGFIGSVGGRIVGIFEEREKRKTLTQQNAHDLAMVDAKSKANLAEIDAQTSAQNLQESYKHDTGYGTGSQWMVNLLRGVRPGLTLYLLTITTYLTWLARDQITADRVDVNQITAGVIYMTMTSITWWFGDRGRK